MKVSPFLNVTRHDLNILLIAYSKQRVTTLFTMFKPAIHDLTNHYFDNDLHQHVLQHSVPKNVTFAASELVSVDISGITSRFPSAETDPTFYLAVYTAIGTFQTVSSSDRCSLLAVLGAAMLGVASSGIGAWSSYKAAV